MNWCWRSGTPQQLSQTGTARQVARPDYIGGQVYLDDYRSTLRFLNPLSFALVPLHPVSRAGIRPGNVGNNAIRGPGAVFGTQQHGLTDLQFLAVALRHPGILETARDEARLLTRRDGGEEAAAALLGTLRPGWQRRRKLAVVG